jgi:hypothetical protein
VAFGAASIILGLAALFNATAFSLAIILIVAGSALVLAAAGALVISPKPASGSGLPAAASGHRLAHQRLASEVKESSAALGRYPASAAGPGQPEAGNRLLPPNRVMTQAVSRVSVSMTRLRACAIDLPAKTLVRPADTSAIATTRW